MDTSHQEAPSLVSADHFGTKPSGDNGALFSEQSFGSPQRGPGPGTEGGESD